MDIIQVKLGDIKSNCYIVKENNECFVVDPGFKSDIVSDFIINHNLTLKFIYITHGHFDHTGGVNQLKEQFKVPVYAPKLDQIWMEDALYNRWLEPILVDIWINDGDKIIFGNREFVVISTPGHSEGSTMLYSKPYLFGGDTVFYQSVGRTDLPFASFDVLMTSIKKVFGLLPNDTIIYPGHGRATTIGYERSFNPFIAGKI